MAASATGTEFSFDDGGALARIAVGLAGTGVRVGLKAGALVSHFGVILQGQVKANVSGRPGPNAVTGDYRRSIDLDVGRDGAGIFANVGTDKVQGPRLEFGFVGEDSLGRHFNQPAYEHFGPAADVVEPKFATAVAALGVSELDDAVKGTKP